MSRRLFSGAFVFFMIVVLFVDSAFAASLLKIGSRGNEVKAMQQKLIELGYLNGKADGVFGPLTRDAVIRFQQAKGLAVDGIAGPNTLNTLYGTSLSSSNDDSQDTDAEPSKISIPDGIFKLGSRGEQVKQLQNRLNELGFSCGVADGIFGNATRIAIINFQRAKGLTVDGIAGPATLSKLFEETPVEDQNSSAGNPSQENPADSEPAESGPEISITQTLKRGSRGEQVKILQNRLNELGYSVGTADGIFGVKTQNAVIAFQKDNGLVADAIVGPKTIEKLFSDISNDSEITEPSEDKKNDQKEDEFDEVDGENDGKEDESNEVEGNDEKEDEPNEEDEEREDESNEEDDEEDQSNEQNGELDEFHGTPGQLAGKIVILDPGHGGSDVGATRNGVYEKDLNLDMALRLKRMLEEAGATVVMTRTTDQYFSLYYRSAFANKYILDNELHKKLQKKDSLKNEYEEKTEQKIKNETERLEKLARIEELQRILMEKKADKPKLATQVDILSTKKLSLEQDWKIKKAQYDQKLFEQQEVSEELNSLKEKLEELKENKSKLETELDNLINQKDELETQNKEIAASIADIEEEMEELKKQIDSPDIDSETKNQLQRKYTEKEINLYSLKAQLSSNEQSCIQVEKEKEFKENQISQIDSEISLIENDVHTKQNKLDSLNDELKIVESIANKALKDFETTKKEFESKKLELDEITEDINSIENEIPVLRDEVNKLDKDVLSLQQELQVLYLEIQKAEIEADYIRSKGELFKDYLNNPELKNRTGIYETDYDPVRNKNYINEDLKEIFDLTKKYYDENAIFISIHCNSTVEEVTNASGIQAYYRDNGPYSSWGTYGVNSQYYENYSAEKREKLAKSLLKNATENANFLGSYSEPYKYDFAVLRETNIVSVLMEIGFINNPHDLELLLQEQIRENVAKGLYEGIVEYFEQIGIED